MFSKWTEINGNRYKIQSVDSYTLWDVTANSRVNEGGMPIPDSKGVHALLRGGLMDWEGDRLPKFSPHEFKNIPFADLGELVGAIMEVSTTSEDDEKN